MPRFDVTEFEYLHPLYLRRELSGQGSLFLVDSHYTFRYRVDGVEKRQTVPDEFPTDLASVPWFARWLISKIGPHCEAAVVHDWHYRAKVIPRKEADNVFLKAMEVANTPWWQRSLMFVSVRLFARRCYGQPPRKARAAATVVRPADAERYAARLLKERDEARHAGDAMAKECLEIAVSENVGDAPEGRLVAALDAYVTATGWAGPAANLVKAHRNSVAEYVAEQRSRRSTIP